MLNPGFMIPACSELKLLRRTELVGWVVVCMYSKTSLKRPLKKAN